MRVLILSTLFPSVGRTRFGTFVEKRALTLAQMPGVDIRIVAPIGLPPLGLHYLPKYKVHRMAPNFEIWEGMPVWRPHYTHLPFTEARHDPGSMARAVRPILKKIRGEFDFDVIDAQYFFPDAVAAAELAAEFNVPVTASARGSDINYWAQLKHPRELINKAGKKLTGMIAVSEKLRQTMIASGLDGDRIEVIRPGVDQNVFHPQDRGKAKSILRVNGPLIVSVGSIDANKGQSFVIDALPQMPGINYIMAGEGPLRGQLESKVAALELGDRVRFLGNIGQNNISQLLAAADVMVLPSANEGLSNAWLEALASGTPIVICDAGGAREVLVDPMQGEIVSRDVGAIAGGIARVLANNPNREAISRTVKHYTWEGKAQALLDHYQRLIDAKQSRVVPMIKASNSR
jgi:teichuronic acid biosynthesis glycosyltransferase TuaC